MHTARTRPGLLEEPGTPYGQQGLGYLSLSGCALTVRGGNDLVPGLSIWDAGIPNSCLTIFREGNTVSYAGVTRLRDT